MSKDSGELLGVAEGRRWGSAWPRYGVAVASVLAATAIREALSPVLGPNAPYLPFTLAVMIAARFGGRGPGFLATGLSTLGVPLLFLPSFRVLDAGLPAAA